VKEQFLEGLLFFIKKISHENSAKIPQGPILPGRAFQKSA